MKVQFHPTTTTYLYEKNSPPNTKEVLSHASDLQNSANKTTSSARILFLKQKIKSNEKNIECMNANLKNCKALSKPAKEGWEEAINEIVKKLRVYQEVLPKNEHIVQLFHKVDELKNLLNVIPLVSSLLDSKALS